MKQIFVLFALLLGVCAANAQETDTVKYAAGNDLYRGYYPETPVPPNGYALRRGSDLCQDGAYHLPRRRPLCRFGKQPHHSGQGGRCGERNPGESHDRGLPGETNFSVICEDGSFFSFNAKYAREPEMLNIEMKDFLENEDTSDFSHTRMNIYFRELAGESPLLVKLIMQSIYKNNDRKVRHLGSKRFGIQFLHL